MTNDNTELFKAVDSYPIFNTETKKILKVLIEYDEPITIKTLELSSQIPNSSCYTKLMRLMNLGLVNKSKGIARNILYEVNHSGIKKVLELHLKTKHILNKI